MRLEPGGVNPAPVRFTFCYRNTQEIESWNHANSPSFCSPSSLAKPRRCHSSASVPSSSTAITIRSLSSSPATKKRSARTSTFSSTASAKGRCGSPTAGTASARFSRLASTNRVQRCCSHGQWQGLVPCHSVSLPPNETHRSQTCCPQPTCMRWAGMTFSPTSEKPQKPLRTRRTTSAAKSSKVKSASPTEAYITSEAHKQPPKTFSTAKP